MSDEKEEKEENTEALSVRINFRVSPRTWELMRQWGDRYGFTGPSTIARMLLTRGLETVLMQGAGVRSAESIEELTRAMEKLNQLASIEGGK